ncbi:MAG TPA: YidB family protein [Candidatus Limnocylindrales bacterium]|nr:YidB family protein [Candidatus Limnocylindrales bacterium]
MDDLAGALGRLGDAGPAGQGGAATAQSPAATIAGLSSAIGAEGGIDPILDKLRAAGYGEQVDSWIGTGGNQTIPPQQLGAALGDEQVQALSANSGISIQSLLPLLAAFLPTIVNMLTPKGETPAGGVNEAAKNSGPDIGDLIGGVLGGLGGMGGATGAGGAGGTQGMPDLGGLLGGILGGQEK